VRLAVDYALKIKTKESGIPLWRMVARIVEKHLLGFHAEPDLAHRVIGDVHDRFARWIGRWGIPIHSERWLARIARLAALKARKEAAETHQAAGPREESLHGAWSPEKDDRVRFLALGRGKEAAGFHENWRADRTADVSAAKTIHRGMRWLDRMRECQRTVSRSQNKLHCHQKPVFGDRYGRPAKGEAGGGKYWVRPGGKGARKTEADHWDCGIELRDGQSAPPDQVWEVVPRYEPGYWFRRYDGPMPQAPREGQGLPPNDLSDGAECLKLWLEGWYYEEIGARLNLSVASVRDKLHREREKRKAEVLNSRVGPGIREPEGSPEPDRHPFDLTEMGWSRGGVMQDRHEQWQREHAEFWEDFRSRESYW